MSDPTRLAVLASGSGTNLQALLEATRDEDFPASVVVVGSDRPRARALERARSAQIPVVAEAMDAHPDRGAWQRALTDALLDRRPEVVVLAGFMRLVSGDFLAHWPQRVVNVHPSLLPAFRGAHAVEEALEYGVKVTGATVHLVDEKVDHGPIIAQRAVRVEPDDTVDSLHGRIQDVEHELLPWCVRLLCEDRIVVDGRRVRIRSG